MTTAPWAVTWDPSATVAISRDRSADDTLTLREGWTGVAQLAIGSLVAVSITVDGEAEPIIVEGSSVTELVLEGVTGLTRLSSIRSVDPTATKSSFFRPPAVPRAGAKAEASTNSGAPAAGPMPSAEPAPVLVPAASSDSSGQEADFDETVVVDADPEAPQDFDETVISAPLPAEEPAASVGQSAPAASSSWNLNDFDETIVEGAAAALPTDTQPAEAEQVATEPVVAESGDFDETVIEPRFEDSLDFDETVLGQGNDEESEAADFDETVLTSGAPLSNAEVLVDQTDDDFDSTVISARPTSGDFDETVIGAASSAAGADFDETVIGAAGGAIASDFDDTIIKAPAAGDGFDDTVITDRGQGIDPRFDDTGFDDTVAGQLVHTPFADNDATVVGAIPADVTVPGAIATPVAEAAPFEQSAPLDATNPVAEPAFAGPTDYSETAVAERPAVPAELYSAFETTLTPPRLFRVQVTSSTGVANYELRGTLYIGRAPALPSEADVSTSALVVVDSPTEEVSGTHLQLRSDHGSLLARDMWSTNGTVVQPPAGAPYRLHPGEEVPVGPGTWLSLGDSVSILVVGGGYGS